MPDVQRRRGKPVGEDKDSNDIGGVMEGDKKGLPARDVSGGSTKETVELDVNHLDARRLSSAVSSPPSLLSTSLLSARSLVLLQLLSRIITFTLNQALLTFASPEVFGTAAIQFDLIGSTLLFLSREGVRGALLRGNSSANPSSSSSSDALAVATRRQKSLNLSLLPLPLFIALSSLLLPLYLHYTPFSTSSQPYFLASLGLHFTSYLLELLSEPYHIQLQSDLNLKVRVQAEGAAVIVKAVVTLASVVLLGGERALLAFGIGQASYGAVILGRFALEFGGGEKAIGMWIPRRIEEKKEKKKGGENKVLASYFDLESYALAKAMTLQSVFKHFLTEGDRIIVSRISPLKDQGGYAIATNYGSLVARIIFQPLEETSRLYFSKISTTTTPSSTSSPATSSSSSSSANTSLLLLSTLLRQSSHLFLLLPAFLPPYLPHLLPLLLPSWSPTQLATPLAILQVYAFYLPLLSANGFLEAFFSATADGEDLGRQSRAMVGCVVVGAAVAGGLTRRGGAGGGGAETALVWSNCVNMVCRILFVAVLFIPKWVRNQGGGGGVGWKEVVPRRGVWVALGVSAVVVRLSERWFFGEGKGGMKALVGHVGVGGVLGIGCLGVLFLSERKSFQNLGTALRKSS